MPIRMFCDRCSHEVSINWVSKRAIISFDGWKAEVMICNPQHGWNEGILCEDCLRDLITKGSLRPKGYGE